MQMLTAQKKTWNSRLSIQKRKEITAIYTEALVSANKLIMLSKCWVHETFAPNIGTFHSFIMLKALMFSSFLAVLTTNVGGNPCPPFSCGDLRNISYPFRHLGDPPECGVEAYELICSGPKATIKINTGTYVVTRINPSSFRVMDTSLDMNSSCPLPQWNEIPYPDFGSYSYNSDAGYWPVDSGGRIDLVTDSIYWACFVNCSRAITDNSIYGPVTCLSSNCSRAIPDNSIYWPVTCLSTSNSYVYVSIRVRNCPIRDLKPFCGYSGMIPLDDDQDVTFNGSYGDIRKMMQKGFPILFPVDGKLRTSSRIIKRCLNESISYFHEQISMAGIMNKTRAFVQSEIQFLVCINDHSYRTKLFWVAVTIVSIIDVAKYINALVVLLRFVFMPLTVWIFLGHKFWRTKISLDAVEKFLRMQEMIGPMRYAYTDIVAITGHFRDKLGQGGYGSVFKGVLLPGNVHVAIKMLEGNSNCNGEDFISEVSTIGRIHHVNVVRLVGFCSDEMRRALVYEYMPQGSLDKYIFSAEKNFSWDKLNEIALGIARGIDYLHQGCDMQILHFDIKPHNILLDKYFIPKVADFGLAKLYPRDISFVPSRALRGTIGYIAPEMISRSFGIISSKSDVYSFGMLLLEMAGGRRNADPNAANSSQAYYPAWVYDRLTQQDHVGEISAHVDAEMHELERKLCIIGLWCIQMKSNDRPTMSEAIEMLEGGIDGLQMPSRPFFCDEGHDHIEDTYHLSSELTEISKEDMSENINV